MCRLQAYPWFDLAKGPRTYTFKSDGSFSRWMLRMSASGAETDDAIEVYLDGKRLSWASTGDFDRQFYEVLFAA